MSVDRYESVLGLSPCEAAILDVLRRAGSSWVSRDRLNNHTASASRQFDHAADVRRPGAVCVQIHSIRKKLGEEAILSAWGRGYTLGAPGVLACRRALSEQVAA